MGAHFGEIGNVADVVPFPVFVDVGREHLLARKFYDPSKSLQNRAAVGTASTQVIDLARARFFKKCGYKAGYIQRVDVVPNLLAIISKDVVGLALEIAFHEVGEKAVEFDPAVVGSGETTSAEAAGFHSEVATVFLNHNVGGDFRCSEEGVFAGVDRKGFSDAIGIGGVVVVPAGFQLFQANCVGLVPINLVGRHMDEGAGDAGAAGGFKKVEGASGVDVKIVERAGGGEVVAGLSGGVDDRSRFEFFDEGQDRGAVTNIEFVMAEGGEGLGEAALVPAGVSAWAKEVGPLVVVDSVDFFAARGKEGDHFGSDQARGAGY